MLNSCNRTAQTLGWVYTTTRGGHQTHHLLIKYFLVDNQNLIDLSTNLKGDYFGTNLSISIDGILNEKSLGCDKLSTICSRQAHSTSQTETDAAILLGQAGGTGKQVCCYI